jgi:hypothetical protein
MSFRLLCIFSISMIFSAVLNARQQITDESDIWCSKGSCSSNPQTEDIIVNIPNVPWNNNQKQITPSGGNGDGQFTFSSEDESVCTVDNNGNVIRVGLGLCVINVIKEANLEYMQKAVQTSFNIECSEQPALALVSNGNWSNQNTRQIHIGGGAGNGQVTWMTNDANICSISNNGLLTRHATGLCNLTATKAADNESFVCSAQGSINFSTVVYSTLDIRNGYNCPAGFTLPTKAQFLEAYNKHLALPDRWGNRSVWYYKNNGSKVWLNVADGHWYHNQMNMTSNQHPSLDSALYWQWRNYRQESSSGGTVKVICIK